jgi:hypothetical protein
MREAQIPSRCLCWLQFLANPETLQCLALAEVAVGPGGAPVDARGADTVEGPPLATVSILRPYSAEPELCLHEVLQSAPGRGDVQRRDPLDAIQGRADAVENYWNDTGT